MHAEASVTSEKNTDLPYKTYSVSSQRNILVSADTVRFNVVVRLNLTMYRPICVHTHTFFRVSRSTTLLEIHSFAARVNFYIQIYYVRNKIGCVFSFIPPISFHHFLCSLLFIRSPSSFVRAITSKEKNYYRSRVWHYEMSTITKNELTNSYQVNTE